MLCLLFAFRFSLFAFSFSLFTYKVTQASYTPSTPLLTAFDTVLIFLLFWSKFFLKKSYTLKNKAISFSSLASA
jgi:hypothetical protein